MPQCELRIRVARIEADLSSTQLTDSCLKTLSKFKNLRTLNLSKTKIEGETISALSQITSLESLNLYGSKLKLDRIDQLSQLTQLKQLYLFQTELYTKSAIQQLRDALPNCEITLDENMI